MAAAAAAAVKAGDLHHHASQATAGPAIPSQATHTTSATAPTAPATLSRTITGSEIAKMKIQVRESISKDYYDVANFYHKTGFAQWLARHPRFEQLTLLVIALNALWIWIDTDLNPGSMLISSPPHFQIVEQFFCIFFSYEWTVRYLAFRRKRDGLKDFWFVFDGLLVGSMVFETWIMSAVFLAANNSGGGGLGNASLLRMARLLRLTRMARMARLLRALPELLILIKGMVAALRSVCFALGLLVMILYVFGIAFTQLCKGTALEPEFETVLKSMHTLLVYGALMDEVSSLIETIEANSIPILMLFYLFILLAALTVMNMLIGVICEMVLTVGETEREKSTLDFVTEKIEELISSAGADQDDDNLISKDEFIGMLNNKKAVTILHQVGVDVVGLVDFADTIFEPSDGDNAQPEKKLTFGEFMDVILDLRGSKTARVKDIVNLRKHINDRFQRLESRMMDIDCLSRYHRARSAMQEGALSGGTTSTSSQTPVDNRTNRTQSHSPHVTTVAKVQDMVTSSLRDLQASHERELAVLHEENLRLLDKLDDLGKAAGKSLAGVLEVASKVPRSTSQQPIDFSILANSSTSTGTAATPTAGPQPPRSPYTHVEISRRDFSWIPQPHTQHDSMMEPRKITSGVR